MSQSPPGEPTASAVRVCAGLCGSILQLPTAACGLECCDQNTMIDEQGWYPHSSRCGLAGGGGRSGLPGDVYGLSLDAFTKHEPMIAGKLAGVIARPQDQVVRLCDHDQFFITSSAEHLISPMRATSSCHFFKFFPPAAGSKAVKGTGSNVLETRKPLLVRRLTG